MEQHVNTLWYWQYRIRPYKNQLDWVEAATYIRLTHQIWNKYSKPGLELIMAWQYDDQGTRQNK